MASRAKREAVPFGQAAQVFGKLSEFVRVLEGALRSQLEATGHQDAPLGAMRAVLLKSHIEEFLTLCRKYDWPGVRDQDELRDLRRVLANFPRRPGLWETLFVLPIFGRAVQRVQGLVPMPPVPPLTMEARTTAVRPGRAGAGGTPPQASTEDTRPQTASKSRRGTFVVGVDVHGHPIYARAVPGAYPVVGQQHIIVTARPAPLAGMGSVAAAGRAAAAFGGRARVHGTRNGAKEGKARNPRQRNR